MKRLWLDLGDFEALIKPAEPMTAWQDHGLGLLRTILHAAGVKTEIASTRAVSCWSQVEAALRGFDMLLMNVRSYTFPMAKRCAEIFKHLNPNGLVIVGGMHASVVPEEMEAVPQFDRICQGAGEQVIVDLVLNPEKYPRMFTGQASKSMNDWPFIDRTLWPANPGIVGYGLDRLKGATEWPLERTTGWGPPPCASVLSTRVCPFSCAFCNEASYIPNMGRRSVDQVIDELNELDAKYGPLGSVIIHDSMFFLHPPWLREWLEKYPKNTRRMWPYWAAGRADTVRKWPDLFEALVRETNWHTVSIGFESGSTTTLKTLNKECTAEDNYVTIDLLNRIGDDFERQGRKAPFFWTNVMWGIPGESREDAFETVRMLQFIKRQMISPAYYAPYPGSILGHQLIAEGKSLMPRDRYCGEPKVKGVDYQFYADLLTGKYAAQVNRKEWAPVIAARQGRLGTESLSHSIYLFDMTDGKQRAAYGSNPDDALKTMSQRCPPQEMSKIRRESFHVTTQKEMRKALPVLG